MLLCYVVLISDIDEDGDSITVRDDVDLCSVFSYYEKVAVENATEGLSPSPITIYPKSAAAGSQVRRNCYACCNMAYRRIGFVCFYVVALFRKPQTHIRFGVCTAV